MSIAYSMAWIVFCSPNMILPEVQQYETLLHSGATLFTLFLYALLKYCKKEVFFIHLILVFLYFVPMNCHWQTKSKHLDKIRHSVLYNFCTIFFMDQKTQKRLCSWGAQWFTATLPILIMKHSDYRCHSALTQNGLDPLFSLSQGQAKIDDRINNCCLNFL